MHQSIDLVTWLDRIGVPGCVAPDLPTLRTVVAAHVAAIPFENLDPFCGVPVSLDPATIRHKLLCDGRGGYCYEQNGLFGEALRAIGFRVTNLAARVLWGQPEDAITARSHMLLRIDLEGRTWLADVGFGGSTPTGPLQLVPDIEQATPHECFRLLRHGADDWRMQARIDGMWRTLYRFDLQPRFPVDYRASNYWLSTHPDSHFVNGLIAARAEPGRRLALRNREFAIHATHGDTQRRTLRDVDEIRTVLAQEFLIRVPAHPDLDRRLAELPG